MDKDKLIGKIKDGDSDEQKELLKQLQEENLHLRIENAFLKEVRRLRLEEEALLKNSENRPQPPRRIQTKGHSRSRLFSKGYVYVLAEETRAWRS